MRHQNSVFHGLTKLIPWSDFERLVAAHGTDYRVRRLTTKSQFLALLYGQLSGSQSLREIEAGMASHQSRLYHLGASAPSRSTLADANAQRPWQVYAELFAEMVARAGAGLRRRMGETLCLIDATTLQLNSLSDDWAQFSHKLTAAKLHLVYDPLCQRPLKAQVTPHNVNDITPAKAFQIEPGATYVFDLAYYDHAWWAELHGHGCRFVTRLKTNSQLCQTVERQGPLGKDILSDKRGFLRKRIGYGRNNPFTDPVREITLRIQSGKILRLVTNDLESPAREIAELYKKRWQIELFFKWIKQNLKIKRFLGTSENAVRTQIFVALIAYLIIKSVHDANSDVAKTASAFARLIRINLMHRRSIAIINQATKQLTQDKRQHAFWPSKT